MAAAAAGSVAEIRARDKRAGAYAEDSGTLAHRQSLGDFSFDPAAVDDPCHAIRMKKLVAVAATATGRRMEKSRKKQR